MQYRRLGNSGIKISALSFGSWVTFKNQLDLKQASELIAYAYDQGVNFFDNAEVYAAGESEKIMGDVFKRLGYRRGSYLVSTKLFWGINEGVNERNTLNRKYLIESVDACLKRLQMDHVDLLYCHRPDSETTIEEVVWTMSDIIQSGKALYWGTSEWSAAEISSACEIAEKRNLRKPVVEQPQYNLFHRKKVETDFVKLYQQQGLGLTIWSPLASGLLTGKYQNGIPANSRLSLKDYDWLKARLISPELLAQVQVVIDLAKKVGCTPAQLSISWCLQNKNVSSVILGATRLEQLQELISYCAEAAPLPADILKALNVIASRDSEILK